MAVSGTDFGEAAKNYGTFRAGLVDEALHWLDKAVEYGSYEVTYIAFWPHLDALRDDSRYENLLRRVYGERAQEIRRLGNSGPGRDR